MHFLCNIEADDTHIVDSVDMLLGNAIVVNDCAFLQIVILSNSIEARQKEWLEIDAIFCQAEVVTI